MKNQEIRTLSVAIRTSAKADAFELNGTALSYNTLSGDLGGFRERFLPGAFTRALATNPDVKMLFNHSADRVLGRTTNGTLQLFDTPTGLNFRCQLDPNQQAHRDLHSSIKRGDINSCSFAFAADDDKFDDAKDERGASFIRRTVKAAQLFDCSVVTNPAYNSPGATSVVARSVTAPTSPRNQKSLEQQYFELTGKEYVSPQLIALRMATLGLQVEADRRALDAENERAARNAAIVRNELFPWENN